MQPQNKLYVGNFSVDVTEADLNLLFSTYGKVEEVKIVMDRFANKSRGFAFVTFALPSSAYAAKDALHGQPYLGKPLSIDIAKEETRVVKPAPSKFGAPKRDFGSKPKSNYRDRNDR